MTWSLAVCLILACATIGIGGLLTDVGSWYFTLDFPRWKPPNWAFAPVWTTIGVCAAFSANYAWRAADSGLARREIAVLFGLNAVLNILWSLLFFRLRRPDWALIEVVPLWLSILAPAIALWPIRPLSSLLLLPYLVWVAVAACLNLSVVRRNAPFVQRPHDPNSSRVFDNQPERDNKRAMMERS